MEDVFGSGVLGHLSAVARESDDLRGLVHRELFQPVWDKAVVQPLGLRLEVETYRYGGRHTWVADVIGWVKKSALRERVGTG